MTKTAFAISVRKPLVAFTWALLFASPTLFADELKGDPKAGSEIYKDVCNACHGVSIAPTLRGVVGRPVASVADYPNYSDGIKAKSELVWTKENLDKFLTDPAAFAPGTQMVQVIPDPQQRADLIAFLAALPPPRK